MKRFQQLNLGMGELGSTFLLIFEEGAIPKSQLYTVKGWQICQSHNFKLSDRIKGGYIVESSEISFSDRG
jgi:hypothetical protein